MLYNNLIFLI